MPNFRRVKIQAIVETSAMLLRDDQVDDVLAEFREKLRPLDLTIVSVEPTEPRAPRNPESTDTDPDPWTCGGHPVN